MDYLVKIFLKKNFDFLRKLLLHFCLKISGYKNFGNFFETGENLYQFTVLLKNYNLFQIMPYNNGLLKIDASRPENNIFHLSNFIFIKK